MGDDLQHDDEPASKRLSLVFAVPEFRALWAAEAVSVVGDQLARVAFSVLVFERTDSPALSALVYALTFLPALVGGALLGWVADRYPRRGVMIAGDVGRTGLALCMVWPGLPLPLLCVLIIATVLLGSPHTAAQGALLPEVLRGELLERGYGVRQITGQAAQVAGFAAGGGLLVAFDPYAALALNAGSFALSALIVALGVRARPAPTLGGHGAPRRWTGDVVEGARIVFGDPTLRTLALVVWLVGCYIAPEGLAVSFAAELGASPLAVGLLMASIPAGSVVGALVFTRWVPQRVRERVTLPLAIAGGLPLVFSAFTPIVAVAVALWSLTGLCVAAVLVQAQAGFIRRTPAEARGRATGIAAAGLLASQGCALLLGGLLAQRWSPSVGVAAIGGSALLLLAALLVTATGRRLVAGAT